MNPLAFDNIIGDTYQLNQHDLDRGLTESRTNKRKRHILPIHRSQDAKVQRLVNFMQPGTYIRPHKHPRPGASESIVVLQGAILVQIFDDKGAILIEQKCVAGSMNSVFDIEANVWHSFVVEKEDTVLFECKMGPYDVELDKIFAPWSLPEEL
jgi:cupin fold WbuC family metalloprotein